MQITDRVKLRPLNVFIHICCILRDIQKNDFKIKWDDMKEMTGNGTFRALYESGATPETHNSRHR